MESRVIPIALIGIVVAIAVSLYLGWPAATVLQEEDLSELMIDAQGQLAKGQETATMNAKAVTGFVDKVVLNQATAMVVGWAVDLEAGTPAVGVVVLVNGRSAAHGAPGLARPDVAAYLKREGTLNSGYSLQVPLPAETAGAKPVLRVFAISASGAVNELHYGAGLALPQR